MSDKEIHRICKKYNIINYTIEDGLVNVNGSVHLNRNEITMLPLKFGKVTGNFICFSNNLVSLEGSPLEVGGGFYCHFNNLTSLKGSPVKVGDGFDCSHNNLTSLEGSPLEVGGNFNCSVNDLKSLEGSPKKVGGDFHCGANTKKLSYEKYLLKVNRLNKLKQLDVR